MSAMLNDQRQQIPVVRLDQDLIPLNAWIDMLQADIFVWSQTTCRLKFGLVQGVAYDGQK